MPLDVQKEHKMLDFLKRRLKNEKGAMDKILVTLLLVIVGVGAVVGLTAWINGETANVQAAATNQIQAVTNNAQGQ
jgi:predicted negative regulator of RcsB-dependent stress response